ncbi:unnamed protein product [Pieris macdunnoughi]|uniref:Uncharacterized protein n=1 Tax=Pieris macdunnoughi TaxID=345717 RepID=A0A821KY42_9NEOP|nr:unnamed protein product [Pieris macdunnoughi]
MEMIGKINGNEFTCNNSFINEYLKFLNNIPKTPDILISNAYIIDLSQDSETQESVNNIIDLEADYKLDNNKNIELNLLKNENLEINTQEIVNNILDLEADYKLDNNKNIELNLPKNENLEINTQEIVNNILDPEADYKLDNNKNIELNLPKNENLEINTQVIVNNILDPEADYKLDNNKNIELKLPKNENLEINTQEIVNNILDPEADYKLDNNKKNIELKLPKNPILNTEIEGNLKETKKRVLENFETSLDDLPLSELSAILRNEETYSVEGLHFEFITEEEAKMKRLYYLNDPITIMEGYFPPPKTVKIHQIPTGNDYLELFQHYPSCSMDTNKSSRPSVRMDRYGIGSDIDMSVSNDVSLESE